MHSLLAALVLFAACSGPPADDVQPIRQGLTILSTPYVGYYNKVIVGRFSASQANTVIFWRNTDSYCQVNQLASPLYDDLDVSLNGAAGSEIQMLAPNQSSSVYCANYGILYTVDRALAVNGHSVYIDGSNSGDYINCGGDGGGYVECQGLDGNDIIDVTNNRADAWGQYGDDKIRVQVTPTTNTKVHGGEGADCIQWSGAGFMGAYECNGNPPSCNPAVPSTCDRSTYQLGASCQLQVAQGSCN